MAGWIDPGIVARNEREAATLRAVLDAGLRLDRVGHQSEAVRLTGAGVHVMAVNLGALLPIDLRRPSPHELRARSYGPTNEARRSRAAVAAPAPTVEAAPQHRRESLGAARYVEPRREIRDGELAGRRPDADLDRLA